MPEDRPTTRVKFWPTFSVLNRRCKERGDLPVNLIFLVEGEEEIGSPNLATFLKEHSSNWHADVVAISDTGMVAPGIPTFTYGLRGILCLEIRLRGPSADLHSGIFGGSVANPATELEPDRGKTYTTIPAGSRFPGFTIASFRWRSGSESFGPNFLTRSEPGWRQPVPREFPAKWGTPFWNKSGPVQPRR